MNTAEHLFTILGEEGAEIAQVCSKINRFGLWDRDPNSDTEGPNNQRKLIEELNDLLGVVKLLVNLGLIPSDWQNLTLQEQKKFKVQRFLKYSEQKGKLTQ